MPDADFFPDRREEVGERRAGRHALRSPTSSQTALSGESADVIYIGCLYSQACLWVGGGSASLMPF